MIHPSTQIRLIDNQAGYGVFATDRIPRGTVIWAQDAFDQLWTPLQCEALPKPQRRLLETYGFPCREGSLLLCWDGRRFLNHSCAPNTLLTEYGFDIAIHDIRPGDQLTCDYAAWSLKRPFSCKCRDEECRGVIHPEDAQLCSADWRQLSAVALTYLTSVEQPLWHLIELKVPLPLSA